ncbi:MAG: hypothetical protein JSR37_09295 [Verrucomicrobia bacterium]|nr:hypothetical protein [Verrucomicrobiota bacterium]MBS0636338.1 hypothetical protein [Verrucomicrobiota bacterium]
MIPNLPTHWTVVAISSPSPTSLQICRWEGSKTLKPVTLKNSQIQACYTIIAAIIAENSAILKQTPTTRDERKKWWDDRRAVDLKLQNALINMQNACFGSYTTLITPLAETLILIPEKGLEYLPWESLPVLQNKRVTRMPSVDSVKIQLQVEMPKFVTRGYYLVDPEDKATALFFKQHFQNRPNWEGTSDATPERSHFIKALTQYDLFIWAGHDAGQKYLPKAELEQQVEKISAISLLLGCNTVAHMVPTYLGKHSPQVIGTLWEVTNVDMNRYAKRFTELYDTQDVLASVRLARAACLLKYLNGASVVVYGLPAE